MATLGPLYIAHADGGVQFWVERRIHDAAHAKVELIVRRYRPTASGRLQGGDPQGPFYVLEDAREHANYLAQLDRARVLIAPKE